MKFSTADVHENLSRSHDFREIGAVIVIIKLGTSKIIYQHFLCGLSTFLNFVNVGKGRPYYSHGGNEITFKPVV
jgi:hypothetical protein